MKKQKKGNFKSIMKMRQELVMTKKGKLSKKVDKYLLADDELNFVVDTDEELYKNFDVAKCEQIFQEKTGKSFDTFFKKYEAKITNFCYSIVKDEELAKDLATESILRGLKKIEKYDPKYGSGIAISTWMFTVARNHCKGYLKMKAKVNVVSMDVELDNEGHTMKDFMAQSELDENSYDLPTQDYYELIERKGKILEECINNLKEPYQQILKWREFDNLSYEEIRVKLCELEKKEVNENTVKSRISNGRIKLEAAVKAKFKELDKEFLLQ